MNENAAEHLADLWEDVHEIENIMGRRAFMNLFIQEPETFYTLWSREDPVLGTNEGFYVGCDAVSAYYEAVRQYMLLRAAAAQTEHPEVLGGRDVSELLGAGAAHMDNITTPVIEVAGDRQTAKALWYALDSEIDYYPDGYGSRMRWGKIAADFRREDGKWKIWHLLLLTDIETELGTDWTTEEKDLPPKQPMASLANYQFPEPTISLPLYEKWHDRRPLSYFPPVPVPYETFSETFSYGAEVMYDHKN